MDQKLECLRDWGCDVDGALERMLGDEELYLECLSMLLEDEGFDALGAALEQGDAAAAFDCAHALKGVLANLGLTPLLDQVEKIVEPLRAGLIDGLLVENRTFQEMKTYLFGILSGEHVSEETCF